LRTPASLIVHYPPSIFILAKHDILTEENVRFIELLQSHGRQVHVKMYNSTIHGFYGKPILSAYGDEALRQSCQDLRSILSTP
jgi:acetyl esterase/lipase